MSTTTKKPPAKAVRKPPVGRKRSKKRLRKRAESLKKKSSKNIQKKFKELPPPVTKTEPEVKRLGAGPDSVTLDEERSYQVFICLGIAMFKTDRQIARDILAHFNLDMTVVNINRNYRHGKKWRRVINFLRERYLRQMSKIPIANKAYRLGLLQDAALEAMTWNVKTINEHGTVFEKKLGTLAQLVREARIEVEGEKPDGGVNIDRSRHTHLTAVSASELSSPQIIDLLLGRFDPNTAGNVLGRSESGGRLSKKPA